MNLRKLISGGLLALGGTLSINAVTVQWAPPPNYSNAGDSYSVGGVGIGVGGIYPYNMVTAKIYRNGTLKKTVTNPYAAQAIYTETPSSTAQSKLSYEAKAIDYYGNYTSVRGTHLVASAPFMAFDSIVSPVSPNARLSGSGWAADAATESGITDVKVYIVVDDEDELLGSATCGYSRPDVAAVFDRDGFVDSGYKFSVMSSGMSLGTHTIKIVATDSMGRTAVRTKTITVSDSASDNDLLPDSWESNYGLNPNDASDQFADYDGDGMSNYQEYTLGYDPSVYNQGTSGFGNQVPWIWEQMADGDGTQTQAVGGTVGELSVDASGGANYTIPLWVTPGSSGMEPQLALVYNSNGGNGLLGRGWSVSGLSAITRVPQTLATDENIHGVDFSIDDRFALDGQRLLLVAGAYGASEAEFKTQMESFSKIKSYGILGSGPRKFKVWTKSGLIMQYGYDTDSCRNASGITDAISWNIDRINDVSGNYMTFTYAENVTNGEHYISRIDYTGNSEAENSTYASVRFEYESRTDTSFGYVAGAKLSTNKRLKYIKVYYGSTLYRKYTLNYTYEGRASTSMLTSLVETGSDGSSFKPLVFEYDSVEEGWESEVTHHKPPVAMYDGLQSNGCGFIDLNGDGYPDFVQAQCTESGSWVSGRRKTWINKWYTWEENSNYNLPYPLMDNSDDYGKDRGTRFVDLNGDGLVDVIHAFENSNNSLTSKAYLNTGSGWSYSSNWNLPTYIRKRNNDGDQKHRYFIDVNGDGRVDFVYNNGSGESGAYLNNGNGWDYNSAWIPPLRNSWDSHAIFMDVNGDGLPDQLKNQTERYAQNAVAINTGSGWTLYTSGAEFDKYKLPLPIARYHSSTLGPNTLDIWGVELTDVNGDGLTDLVGYDSFTLNSTNPTPSTYLNTGAGWVLSSAYQSRIQLGCKGANYGAAFIDVNGDGLVDVVRNEGTSATKMVSYNTGRGFTSTYGHDNYVPYQLDLEVGEPTEPSGYQFVDINADGAVDQVYYLASDSGVPQDYGSYLNKATPHGRLVKVTNAMGVSAEIGYAPLTKRSATSEFTLYTPADNIISDAANVIGPMYVVDYLDHEDGIGGTYTVNYSYSGLRAHRLYGSLGFESISITDTLKNVVTTTQYSQVFPFIGRPVASSTALLDDNGGQPAILSESSTTYECVDNIDRDPGMTDAQVAAMSYHNHFVFASSSISSSFELDKNLSSETITLMSAGGFDRYGNVKSMVVKTGVPGEYKTVESTNVYTNYTSNGAWVLGRLTSSTSETTVGTESATKTSGFSYYSNGLLKEEEVEPGLANGGDDNNVHLLKTYNYDDYGNISRVTVSGSGLVGDRVTITNYDSRGRFPETVTQVKDNNESFTETFDYYDGIGKLKQHWDINNQAESYSYDGFGRVTGKVNAIDVSTSIVRRWANSFAPEGAVYFVKTETEGAPPSMVYFDAMGRETYTYVISPSGSDTSAKVTGVAVFYDAQGRVYQKSNPFWLGESELMNIGSYTVFEDATDRPLEVGILSPEGDDGWAVTTYDYFGLVGGGVMSQTTNPAGQITQIYKNAFGQVDEVINNADQATPGEEIGHLSYTYDVVGNLKTTTVYKNDGSTEIGYSTIFEYDLAGRKIDMEDPSMGDAYENETIVTRTVNDYSYTYNALGELISQTDANGKTTTMVYDRLGRLVEKHFPEGTTTWFYDTADRGTLKWKGLLHKVETNKPAETADRRLYRETYAYDAHGRLTQTERLIDGVTYTTGQSYDSYGRPSVLTYPNDFKVENLYDDFGTLKEVVEGNGTRHTNFDGEVGAGQKFWQAYHYSVWGRPDGVDFGESVSTTYQYNAWNGRLDGLLTESDVGNNTVVDIGYAYDELGNITNRAVSVFGENTIYEVFDYDGLNRLESYTQTGEGTKDVEYDSLGNITSKTGVGNYTYGTNKAYRLTNTSTRDKEYIHDKNGNMLSESLYNTVSHRRELIRSYNYDSGNRITKIQDGTHSSLWTKFWFDSNGQRVILEECNDASNGVLTHYVGSAYEVRKDVGSGSYEEKCYIMTPTGRTAVRTVKKNSSNTVTDVGFRLYHKDNLGSVYAVTDKDGTIECRSSYDPWGVETALDDDGSDPDFSLETRGYTDHEMLRTWGLIHMNGRIFNPELARFMSADPFIDDAKDAQSFNRYAYCNNSPINHSDPSGFFKLKDGLKIVAVAVAAYFTAGWAINSFGFTSVTVETAVGTSEAFMAANSSLATSLMLSGASPGLVNGIIGAAVSGFTAGSVGTLLNGGSVEDAFRNGVVGGVTAAFTAGASYWIASLPKGGNKWYFFQRMGGEHISQGVLRGLVNESQGGEFRHGFVSGALNSMLTDPINDFYQGYESVESIMVSSILGGTVSAVSGGKFANGAFYSAIDHMLQSSAKKNSMERLMKKSITNKTRVLEVYITKRSIFSFLGFSTHHVFVADPAGSIGIWGRDGSLQMGDFVVETVGNDPQTYEELKAQYHDVNNRTFEFAGFIVFDSDSSVGQYFDLLDAQGRGGLYFPWANDCHNSLFFPMNRLNGYFVPLNEDSYWGRVTSE